MSNEETLKALGASARALFTAEQLREFEGAFDKQATYCRSKNYSEEGIPMFLVLEDVSGTPSTESAPVIATESTAPRDSLFDLLLVTATEVYKQQLESKGEPLEAKDIGLLLEVLGEHFFTTAQSPKLIGRT